MKLLILSVFTLSIVGVILGYPTELIEAVIEDDNTSPQSRNFLQQLLINQIVNVLPANIRDGINDAAALLGLSRNDFLIRVLKELQAFQTYSKIDFITAIQKTVKFADEKLTNEQKKELETLETQGIEFGKLLFSNKIRPDQMNKVYDLIVKIVRQQIDGQTLVSELKILVNEIVPASY